MEKEPRERRKPPARVGKEKQGAGKDPRRKEGAVTLRFSSLILNASALAVPKEPGVKSEQALTSDPKLPSALHFFQAHSPETSCNPPTPCPQQPLLSPSLGTT